MAVLHQEDYATLLLRYEAALREIAELRKTVKEKDAACLLAEQELLCIRTVCLQCTWLLYLPIKIVQFIVQSN